MYQVAKVLGELGKVGAKVALLATRDGLLIESVTGQQPSPDLDSAAAGAASALEAAKLMAGGLTPVDVRGMLVELEHGGVMTVHPIGDEMILAVLSDTIGGLGRLLVELRRLIPVLTAAVGDGVGYDHGSTAAFSEADDTAETEDTHAVFVISPQAVSVGGDEERAHAGSRPEASQRGAGSAAHAPTTNLPQVAQPAEAESVPAVTRSGPLGLAQADHRVSPSERSEPPSAEGTNSTQRAQGEPARVQAADLREAATDASIDMVLHNGATSDAIPADAVSRSTATMRSEAEIGIALVGVHLDVTGQAATATVEVAYQEHQATGRAVGRNQPARTLFLVAEAAAQAVTKLLPPQHGVMVETVPSFTSEAGETLPRLVWLSPTGDEVRLEVARADDNSPEGVAKAVLHAVNECLGALLAKH